ncbi:MAG: PAS domain S-box protein, partial [Planctomycetota bacterium]
MELYLHAKSVRTSSERPDRVRVQDILICVVFACAVVLFNGPADARQRIDPVGSAAPGTAQVENFTVGTNDASETSADERHPGSPPESGASEFAPESDDFAPSLRASGSGTRPIRIGVTQIRGTEKCFEMWNPLADYLGEALQNEGFDLHVEIVPLTLGADEAALRAGAIEFMLTQPSNYVQLSEYGTLTRTLTLRSRQPGESDTRFGAVIFTRVDRTDILTLDDLRGKRFAAVDERAFGGWQMAWREMLDQGIKPHQDLREIVFTGLPQDQIVHAVIEGRVDAGTVRASILERMAAEGLVRLSSVRILNERIEPGFPYRLSTRLYPEWAFAQKRGIADDLSRVINRALLDLTPDHPAAIAANIDGFIPPLSYASIHECLRELQVGIYAQDRRELLAEAVDANQAMIVAAAGGILVVLVAFVLVLRASIRLRRARTRLWKELDSRHALESQLRQLAIVASHTDNTVIVTDRDGAITWVNDAFVSTTGYEMKEAVGQNPNMLLSSPNAEPRVLQFMAEQVRSGRGFNVETLNRDRTGRDYWVSLDVRPVHDATTKTLSGFVGVARDITKRREIDAQLKSSREMLHTVLDTVPQMIFWKDRESRYLGCNREFLKVAGLERVSDIVGLQDDDVTALAPYAARFQAADREVLNTGRPHWACMTYPREDGADRWIDQVRMPLHDGEGRTIGIMCFEEDVTDRREAIQRLRESERRYHDMFEKLADPAVVIDIDSGEISDANRSALSFFRLTVDQMIGLHHDQLYPEEIRERCTASLPDGVESRDEKRFSAEVLIDGEATAVDVAASAMKLNGRHVIVIMYRDMRVQRQAEARIAARLQYEEALANCAQVLVSGSEDAIVRALDFIRSAFEVTSVNFCKCETSAEPGGGPWPASCVCGHSARHCDRMPAGTCRAYGDAFRRWEPLLRSGEHVIITGAQAATSLPPEMYQRGVRCCILLPVIIGEEVRCFIAVEDADASREWNAEDLAVIRTAAEMVAAHLQRSEADRALRLKQQHLDLALDAANQGVWEWNIQTNRFKVSQQYLDMLGLDWATEDVAFEKVMSLVPATDRVLVESQFDACRTGRQHRCRLEVRLRVGDKAWKWVLIAGEVVERSDEAGPLRMV